MFEKKTFRNLEVWQQCRMLRKEIWEMCKLFPVDEKHRLSDQMIRASRGTTANIAEGYGRYNFQENIQFCRIARGSLIELIDHLTCALDCRFISEEKFKEIEDCINSCGRLLNGYINYLIKSKKEYGKNVSEEFVEYDPNSPN